MKTGIKVFAPATVSNLGCGFDLLGFAINGPGDVIKAKFCDTPGIRITKITKGKMLPREAHKNTAGVSAMAVLEFLGKEKEIGIELEIHKKMPFGSGMGSSAASAVGAAVAVNELLDRPLTKWQLLPMVSKGEQIASGGAIHLDNVAPSLLGGLIFNRNNAEFDVHRVYTPKGIYCSLVYPHIKILTKDARDILSPTTTLKQHVEQSANLGGLLLGFINGDLDLVARSLKDVIVEPQRAKLITGFYDVQKAAMEAGAMGCSISGAGPSIFALSSNSLIAEEVGKAMGEVYERLGIQHNLYVSTINNEGALLF